MDRGVWQATVHGVAELDMTELLSPAVPGATLGTCWETRVGVLPCWNVCSRGRWYHGGCQKVIDAVREKNSAE